MDLAEQVRRILSSRDLTLYRVSQQSAQIFGRSSRFYVPHNLYYDVAHPSSVPTIHQMLALSRITNYRLSDWLAAFGLDPDMISRLQLLIPRRQTTLLDSSIYDTHAWIPWFADRLAEAPIPPIAPLTQLLAPTSPRRASELVALNRRRFLYGRIGESDVQAFPQLAPGSIVRVDEHYPEQLLTDGENNAERRLFFLELNSGWTCSQISVLGKDRITLKSPQSPCQQTELTIGSEVKIVGVIDAEIRPVAHRGVLGTSKLPGVPVKPKALQSPNPRSNLMELLRSSRLRLGLSFREASFLSRWIASTISDEFYFAAASTLSDYEALAVPPRHIQKIITLCVLYCIDFRQFLQSSALPLDQEGRDPIPDELVSRWVPNECPAAHARDEEDRRSSLLRPLVEQWEEIPLFLWHSLNQVTGMKNFSLSDVFWVGGDKAPIHPLLTNATFVVVNRRVKKPVPPRTDDSCKQPLYLVLKRDGTYLCGSCVLRKDNLIVDGYPRGPHGKQQLRNEVDAEVVGRVTTILRRLR